MLVIVAALCAIGAIMVFSASSALAYTAYHDSTYFLKREILWLVIGAGAVWFGARMDYGRLRAVAAVAVRSRGRAPHRRFDPATGTMEGGAGLAGSPTAPSRSNRRSSRSSC
jgi:hypothetical protein